MYSFILTIKPVKDNIKSCPKVWKLLFAANKFLFVLRGLIESDGGIIKYFSKEDFFPLKKQSVKV